VSICDLHDPSTPWLSHVFLVLGIASDAD